MRLLAPAKINLFLRVGPKSGPKSADGFHPIVSWMCTVGLFDTLLFDTLILESRPAGARVATPDSSRDAAIDAQSAKAEDCSFSLHCDDPALPTDERNLVVRAARAIRAAESLARIDDDRGETSSSARRDSTARSPGRTTGRSVSISLQKRIPSGGGLGGGSSDAARTLLGLNRFWSLGLSIGQLSTLAAQLGSDVPFFLHGPSSICTGRGETVQPIASPGCKACLLILPGVNVPTADVYRRLDEIPAAESDWSAQPAWHEWTKLGASELLPKLANDLEAPAYDLHPELRRLHLQAQELLARPVRMSGSGSSLFSLYDTLPEAEAASKNFRERIHINSIAVPLAPMIDDDLAR